MKIFYVVFLFTFFVANSHAQMVAGSEPSHAADASIGLTGRWQLYGWPCGKAANEAVVQVEHYQSLIAVTMLESACEKDQYLINKLYMTGWVDQTENQILFQRISYNSRDGSPADSQIRIGKIYQDNQLIVMYRARYPNQRLLMIKRAQQ